MSDLNILFPGTGKVRYLLSTGYIKQIKLIKFLNFDQLLIR